MRGLVNDSKIRDPPEAVIINFTAARLTTALWQLCFFQLFSSKDFKVSAIDYQLCYHKDARFYLEMLRILQNHSILPSTRICKII